MIKYWKLHQQTTKNQILFVRIVKAFLIFEQYKSNHKKRLSLNKSTFFIQRKFFKPFCFSRMECLQSMIKKPCFFPTLEIIFLQFFFRSRNRSGVTPMTPETRFRLSRSKWRRPLDFLSRFFSSNHEKKIIISKFNSV